MIQRWGGFLAIALLASPWLALTERVRAEAVPPMVMAQAGGTDELAYSQMEQAMRGALGEILPFMTTLSQMEQVQTDEQLLSIAQQLAPMANRITTNFGQAYQAGERLLPMLPAGTIETEYMGNIVTINGLGALAFSPWQEIFVQIQRAYQLDNPAMLEVAITKVSPAVVKLAEFVEQFQSVMHQQQQIQTAQTSNSNMSARDFERLSAIHRMGHETSMGIINGLTSDGAWQFNSGTGKYEYEYY